LIAGIAVTVVLMVGALGCGARTASSNEDCPAAELLSTPLRGSDIVTAETCSFVEQQDGRLHRVECDGEQCRWYVDEALTCVCANLDYGNVCPNGIPLCSDWMEHFDFSLP
jgi:hypothetical protein